jgi:hypothetical protein
VSHRGSSSSANALASDVTSTQAITCRPILSRHYASMIQDGLQIAGPLGVGGEVGGPPPTHPYKNPLYGYKNPLYGCVYGGPPFFWAELQPGDGVQTPLFF